MAFENEIAAVLDLRYGVEAGQVHLAAFLLGELGPQDEGPVIKLSANDRRGQPIGGRLQSRHIAHGNKGIVILAKADSGALQFPLHEGVAVEPVGGMEGEETGYTHDDRSQNFIPDIEIVMSETAPLLRQDTVIRVLGGIPRHGDTERAALFHALED